MSKKRKIWVEGEREKLTLRHKIKGGTKMRATTSVENLEKALAEVNKKYDSNICWNRHPHTGGFTLKVHDSKGPGARRGFTGRRLINACWHVHGHFFEALFEIDPDVVIHSNGKLITKDYGNWEDRNIGSIINPLFYSEACDCN